VVKRKIAGIKPVPTTVVPDGILIKPVPTTVVPDGLLIKISPVEMHVLVSLSMALNTQVSN
jgi:hypothetical protein